MSTETTKARIKIDNGTNFGRVYTDKIVDVKISGLQTAIDGKAPKQTTGDIIIAKEDSGNADLLDITSKYTYDENGVLKPNAPIYYSYKAAAVNTKINAVKSTADACVKTVNIVSNQSPAGYSFNLVSADGKTTVGSILFDASLKPTISPDNQHTLKVSCPYTITFED